MHSGFWAASGIVSASEVDLAGDLTELADHASLIVRGSIEAVSPGPSFPITSDDGRVDEGPTSFVTVKVDDVVKGSPGETVTVWLSGVCPMDRAPSEAYLWYLKPSERPGIMYAANRTGVIGPADDGSLATVLVPGDTSIVVPPDVTSVDALQEATEDVVAPG